MKKIGGKIGCKVLLKELTRSRANAEIDKG